MDGNTVTFKRKIIFLDIDGVLNTTEQSISNRAFNGKGPARRYNDIDEIRLGLLKWLCDQTGAEIVISSTWRKGRDIGWFEGFFASYGWIRPPIIGMTPSVASFRGKEINAWLDGNTHYSSNCTYVIFDDDSDFFEDQTFIHTNRNAGLTIHHVFRAIDILGYSDKLDEREIEISKSLRESVEFKRKTTLGN